MANKTVSNLNELTTVSNSDVLLVETATETLKVTKGNLLKEVNEQLNAKSNASHTHDEYVTENELNSKGLATETFVEEKLVGLGSQPGTLVQVSVTGNTLQLTKDKYQYSVLSNGNGVSLPSVSSFAEIHLFFKTTSEITLVLPSVRWQTQPTIQANKTYEFIFTYVKDEWLGGVVEYA